MQTTLRLNDDLYRSAKARAAEEGVTLTRFIEGALAARLLQPLGRLVPPLPAYDSGVILPAGFDLLAAMAEADATMDAQRANGILTPTRQP